MADRNLTFRIGAQDDFTRVSSRIARQAGRDMGQVEDALDDGRSAGKRLADAMSEVADELDRELKDTARAADRLAEALGPEFVSKVRAGELDVFVNDLRKAGLTIDEIEAEADELAAALKRMDDVHVNAGQRIRGSFDGVSDSVRRTGDEVDRTQSVTANFAGNAVQDIPGISNSFGALNVAAGQFAEYAAEGGIRLRSFAAAIGPLALGTVVVQQIAAGFERAAKVRAFRGDQVSDWVDKMRDGATAVEAMVESMEEAGKLEFGFTGGFSDVVDFVPVLADAGVSMEDFGRLTQASQEQLDTWEQRMLDAGVSADTVNGVIAAVTLAKGQLATATEQAAVQEQVFGTETDDSAASTERLTRQIERNTEKLESRRAKIEEVIDAQRRLSGEEVDQERALLDLADAQDRYVEVQADSEASDRDRQRALLDVFDAHVRYGESVADAAEANEIAQGNITGAAEAAEQAQIEALLRVAAQLEPGSPVRLRLEEYINRLIEAGEPREAVLTIREQRIAAQDEGRQQATGQAGQSTSTVNNINVTVESTANPDEIGRSIAWHVN